jgi:hypothetical protein
MKKLPLMLLVLLSSSSSLAQTKARSAPEEVDASYEFEDDPLSALNQREAIPRIRSRVGTRRTTLIRPRFHFIAELKKSVENL